MRTISRKNGNANRPRRKTADGKRRTQGRGYQPCAPIEKIAVPSGKCGRKLRFEKESDAKAALEQAQVRRRAEHSTHGEKRYYMCDRCNGFHLTSRLEWHEGDKS